MNFFPADLQNNVPPKTTYKTLLNTMKLPKTTTIYCNRHRGMFSVDNCLRRLVVYTEHDFHLILGFKLSSQTLVFTLNWVQEKDIYTDSGFHLKSDFTKQMIPALGATCTSTTINNEHIQICVICIFVQFEHGLL